MLANKLSKADEATKTRVWIAIRSHINRYVNVSYTTKDDELGTKSFFVSDSKVDDPAKRFPAEWGENLVSASEVFAGY